MKFETILKFFILHLYNKYPHNYVRILSSKKFNFILAFLYKKFPKLQNTFYNNKTRIYWFLNNINDFLVCCRKECNNKILKNVDSIISGYSVIYSSPKKFHCCTRCAQLDLETIKSIKNTKLQHYNNKNFNNRQKAEESCLKKYGCKNVSQVKEVKEKIKQTSIINNSNKKRQESLIKTNLSKYGCKNVFQTDIIKNKIKQTWEKHGYDHPMHNRNIVAKTINRYKYNNINFDSSWELALYIYLKDKNINFEYHPNICFEYYFNNTKHIYWPDFIINEIIYEIKGCQYFSNGHMICPYDRSKDDLFQAKYNCMLENSIKIISKNEITKYLNYIFKKYGKQYLKQFCTKNKK